MTATLAQWTRLARVGRYGAYVAVVRGCEGYGIHVVETLLAAVVAAIKPSGRRARA